MRGNAVASLKERIEIIEGSLAKVYEVVDARQNDLANIQEELELIASHLDELKAETVG